MFFLKKLKNMVTFFLKKAFSSEAKKKWDVGLRKEWPSLK